MRTAQRRVLGCGIALALTGCLSYGHSRPLDAVPMPAAPGDRFEVWTDGKGYSLHALRLDGDTLRGVPWSDDISCDSCAVAIPRASVDSVRVPSVNAGETGIMVVVMAAIIFPFVLGLMLAGT